jgi:hypothetical protein
VYLTENTSQAASVEFVCHRQTNYARSRLQKVWRKRPKDFFDKLTGGAEAPPVFCSSPAPAKQLDTAGNLRYNESISNPQLPKRRGYLHEKASETGTDRPLSGSAADWLQL